MNVLNLASALRRQLNESDALVQALGGEIAERMFALNRQFLRLLRSSSTLTVAKPSDQLLKDLSDDAVLQIANSLPVPLFAAQNLDVLGRKGSSDSPLPAGAAAFVVEYLATARELANELPDLLSPLLGLTPDSLQALKSMRADQLAQAPIGDIRFESRIDFSGLNWETPEQFEFQFLELLHRLIAGAHEIPSATHPWIDVWDESGEDEKKAEEAFRGIIVRGAHTLSAMNMFRSGGNPRMVAKYLPYANRGTAGAMKGASIPVRFGKPYRNWVQVRRTFPVQELALLIRLFTLFDNLSPVSRIHLSYQVYRYLISFVTDRAISYDAAGDIVDIYDAQYLRTNPCTNANSGCDRGYFISHNDSDQVHQTNCALCRKRGMVFTG
jgi:hypothetical protein